MLSRASSPTQSLTVVPRDKQLCKQLLAIVRSLVVLLCLPEGLIISGGSRVICCECWQCEKGAVVQVRSELCLWPRLPKQNILPLFITIPVWIHLILSKGACHLQIFRTEDLGSLSLVCSILVRRVALSCSSTIVLAGYSFLAYANPMALNNAAPRAS